MVAGQHQHGIHAGVDAALDIGVQPVTQQDGLFFGKTVPLPIDDDQYLDELNKRIATSRRKEVGDMVLDTEGTYK